MSPDSYHIAVAIFLAILLGLADHPASAQEIPLAAVSHPEPTRHAFIPGARSDTLLFQQVGIEPGVGYTPLYLPEQEIPFDLFSRSEGATAGSAEWPQPALDSSCFSACSISGNSGDGSHPPDGGSAGQNTTALVLGTMGATLSAVLVSQMDRKPGWRSVDLLPHLAIGPAGGLYCGVQLAIHLR